MSMTLLRNQQGKVIAYESTTAAGTRLHLGAPSQAALRTSQVNRCPDCQRYRDNSNAACSNCGALPIPAPQPAQAVTPGPIPMPVAAPWWEPAAHPVPPRDLPFPPVNWTPKTGPATNMGERLDMAIAARTLGRVGNFTPPPVPARVAIVPARARLSFAPTGSLFDRIIQRQQDIGRQPATTTEAPRTMGAQAPCERCHKQACGCPPKAPSVLALVAQRQAARLATMEQAAVDAGLPAIEKRVGMNR